MLIVMFVGKWCTVKIILTLNGFLSGTYTHSIKVMIRKKKSKEIFITEWDLSV